MNITPTSLPDPAILATPRVLSHLALLKVRGADARTFLDAQLTRNVPATSGEATLAGYCSPKGRLLATFTTWADDDGVALLVSGDIAAAIAKRLRMYVLRSKATIEDVTSTHRIEGVVASAHAPSEAVWRVRSDAGATWIRLPDVDGRTRHLRVAAADSAADDDAVDDETWRWLDVRGALPNVTGAVQDRFVPQMVNLEALGGVDFKKGCYPGQEVVARSQYLGKLKRRMAVATLPASSPLPAAGVDVLDGADPIGMVVSAVRDPDGGVALLVELPLTHFASTALTIEANGPALALASPPYPLPDNEVFVRPKL